MVGYKVANFDKLQMAHFRETMPLSFPRFPLAALFWEAK